jgi:hypothetical protein
MQAIVVVHCAYCHRVMRTTACLVIPTTACPTTACLTAALCAKRWSFNTEGNHEACNTTASQAVFYAEQIEKYALGNPEKFTAEPSLTLADISRGMQWQQSSGMRQRDMRDMFAPA